MAVDSLMVKKLADRHLIYTCLLVIVLTVLSMFALEYLDAKQYVTEMKICAYYSFIAGLIYNRSWKRVEQREKLDMTKFYLIASGVRMFIAALAVLIYCVVVREKEPVLYFVTLFLAFYFIMLVFDSVFFARVEKGNKLKTKK